MHRRFSHYEVWEDWHAGLYRKLPPGDYDVFADNSREILADPDTFERVAREMIATWPHAAAFNLSNAGQNRRAWVGQAACCYSHDAPEDATKIAWWLLTDPERDAANAAADRVIDSWEEAQHRAETLFAN